MTDRCNWTLDDDGNAALIPRCWGSALDPFGCTCGVEGSALEQAERRRDIAEGEVLRLHEKAMRARELYEQTLRWQRCLIKEITRLKAENAAIRKRGEGKP